MSDFTTIIELDSIDSTNNYAMQLIDANKAHSGLTVVAKTQTGGKGQRGRSWVDRPGEALLMSVIVVPKQEIRQQFAFNASIATAIATVLQDSAGCSSIHIKWPNDLIVNDKKAGGILIENVLRGNAWAYSVIGLGLNVLQQEFPTELPFATSIKMATGKEVDMVKLRDDIWASVMEVVTFPKNEDEIMSRYNLLLYKRGQKQKFGDESGVWEATIVDAHKDGTIELAMEDDTRVFCRHGAVIWEWEQTDG